MEEKGYTYLMRPLVSRGIMFLVAYPVVLGLLYLFLKFPSLELKVLISIYAVIALGIIILWIVAKTKRVYVKDDEIIFQSLLGEKKILPADIRRVVFSWTADGHEVVVIRTAKDSYYLSEFYFPFPELMADLENLIQCNNVRCNR